MKKRIIFLVLMLFFVQTISAGGVGISPVYYKDFFEPGLEKSYTFHSFNSDAEKGVNLYVEGDLAQYINLSKTYILGSGEFVAIIKLPEKIDRPGVHKIFVGAIEANGEETEGTIGGIAAIQGRIDIIVPYPGEYSESTFKIPNINQGEEVSYEIETQNLGTATLTIKPLIEIFKTNTTELLLTKKLPETELKSKESQRLTGTLDTRDFPPGEYQAFATIGWGKEQARLNQTFRVGEFLVEIVDYDYRFYEGKIVPFNIKIQNKWNSKIDEVFASVSITDQGTVVKDFKTVSVETTPWETKNITGYFDTAGLETKRYTARILLSFGGETTSKLVAIYIEKSPVTIYKNYIIMAIISIILIAAIFTYLIWKIRQLSKKNEKKK